MRTAGSSLLSGCVTGLDLGTAHDLHRLSGLSASQDMDEDAPAHVCKMCWKEVGATAPAVRMVDGIMALIYRYSPSLLPIPCRRGQGPLGISDGLEEFPC